MISSPEGETSKQKYWDSISRLATSWVATISGIASQGTSSSSGFPSAFSCWTPMVIRDLMSRGISNLMVPKLPKSVRPSW